ncbi:MAG: class B sortase [Oscillospiraceae bacterium]|nr:class B sortase [Oscillospiraceae bacterium]
MKQVIRKRLALLLSIVCALSIWMMIRQTADKAVAANSYDDARLLAENTDTVQETQETQVQETEPKTRTVWVIAPVKDDPEIELLKEIDLDALRQVNPDVIGWIRIPQTQIDYPIMQGTDNDYYLDHTWDHKSNAVGSIYMEYRNSPEFFDYNTLIYGHNMKGGSMFAQLRNYSEQQFFEEHPYVYIVTDGGILRYEIFSSYKAPVDSAAYKLSFQQAQTRKDFLAYVLESSVIESNIEPGIRDRILTLSTCSAAGYTTRWVVHARLRMVQQEI